MRSVRASASSELTPRRSVHDVWHSPDVVVVGVGVVVVVEVLVVVVVVVVVDVSVDKR